MITFAPQYSLSNFAILVLINLATIVMYVDVDWQTPMDRTPMEFSGFLNILIFKTTNKRK